MRRKGEKGSLPSSATFVGLWQLCHHLNLSLQVPLFPVSTGSPWQLGGSLTFCSLISPQVQTTSGASWGGFPLPPGASGSGRCVSPFPLSPIPVCSLVASPRGTRTAGEG